MFVAARFTTAMDDNGFDPQLKDIIHHAHTGVTNAGCVVSSAHRIEQFGKSLAKPADFIPRDHAEVKDCDVFVVVIDKSVSVGASAECGWASELGKSMLLYFLPGVDKLPYRCLEGFCRLTSSQFHDVTSPEDLSRCITNDLKVLMEHGQHPHRTLRG